MSGVEDSKKPSDDTESSLARRTLLSPVNLGLVLISRSFSLLRPHAPTLIPIVVCSLFIPVILLLSIFSGWYVWSNLSVSWQAPLYFQYGDGAVPHAYKELPIMHTRQHYHISINLVVPTSEANIELGNFMTSLIIFTTGNETLVDARRPAIVLPSKNYYFLAKPVTTEVRIPMLESFIPTKQNLLAFVEIGRKDSWTKIGSGQAREVSIMSASIRGLAVPHGIRGLAIRAPFVTAILSACVFFFILSILVGSCLLPLVLPPMSPEESEEPDSDAKAEVKSRISTSQYPTPERAKERRRKYSRSSKTSRESLTRMKVEAPHESIPSAIEDPTRGLRRRSSRSLRTSSVERH